MRRADTPPVSRIDRARYGLTALGTVMCLLPLLQLIFQPVTPVASLFGLLAGLTNAVVVSGPSLRGRYEPVLVPVTGALVAIVGITSYDPATTIGICVGVTVATTMYGSRRGVAARQVALAGAVAASALLSISPGRGVAWTVAGTFAAVPSIAIFAGLIYLLREGLTSQAASIVRERFMASLSSDLLAADTVPRIVTAMIRSNAGLIELSPGLIILETIRIGPGEPGPTGGARVVGAHGIGREEVPDVLPAEALTELPPIGVERFLPLIAGSQLLTERGLPPRRWHVAALAREPGAPVDLVLHGVRVGLGQKLFGVLSPEEAEFQDILSVRTKHWRAAMARAQERTDLLAAEERDDVTGLPDRAAVMRRLIEMIHAERQRMALVVLQLGGMETVEAERGLAATDGAMEQLAHRVTDVVGGRGYAARSGDASFTVLVPAADDFDEIETLVARLEDALQEPVLLPGGGMRLSLSVGIARTTEPGGPQGNTAADLLQRAVGSMSLHQAGLREASA